MKDILLKGYYIVYNRYLDYRYKIPENAGICFAYYLILSIIPICSIFTFFAYLWNVDLTIVQDFLERYLTEEFSVIIIGALTSKKITFSSFVAIAVSFWVVSRGINQLYGITKNLFPPNHDRNFIVERIFSILKTILVFILIVLIISLLGLMSIANTIFPFNKMIFFDHIYLFLVFFVIFFLLYKIIPDVHVHIKDIFAGSFVTSVLMIVLVSLLKLYFSFSNYTNVYGQFASIAVILFSFTYIAEVIYIGLYVMFEAHMKRLIIEIKKGMEEKES